MTLQSSKTINLFDIYQILLPSGLNYHQDGIIGKRVLFITDSDSSFVVSFEENMECMDLSAEKMGSEPTVCVQYRSGNKYIHQRRFNRHSTSFAFFHIELKNEDGEIMYLPGQIVTNQDYQWTEGVEPILLKLLDGISIL